MHTVYQSLCFPYPLRRLFESTGTMTNSNKASPQSHRQGLDPSGVIQREPFSVQIRNNGVERSNWVRLGCSSNLKLDYSSSAVFEKVFRRCFDLVWALKTVFHQQRNALSRSKKPGVAGSGQYPVQTESRSRIASRLQPVVSDAGKMEVGSTG